MSQLQLHYGDLPQPTLSDSGSSTHSCEVDEEREEPNWPKEWQAYTALFGCFLLMFNSWGIVNAYGTFSSYYLQHLLPGIDPLKLNLIGSTESFIVLALSGITGRLLDAGYYRMLTGVGWGLISVGMFSLSGANGDGLDGQGNYGLVWITQGFVLGLGMACFFVTSSQIAATWFHKKKAFAIGIVACGASIAGLIYPLATKRLITQLGFNHAVQSISGLTAGTALLSFFLSQPKPDAPFTPPAQGWFHPTTWLDRSAFRRKSYIFFVVSICLTFFGFYAIFFNLEEWAAVRGFGSRDAAPDHWKFTQDSGEREVPKDAIRTWYLLSMMNACSTVGRLGSAWLSDHWGALNVHCGVTVVASAFVLLLWTLAGTAGAAIAFVVLFGAVSGAVIGLPAASVAHILGSKRSERAKLGHWTGMMYTAASPFALAGPVIAGHLLRRYGKVDNFISVQLWSGFCLLLAASSMAVAIYFHRREIGQEGSVRAALSSAATSRMSIFGSERRRLGTEGSGNVTRSMTMEGDVPVLGTSQRDEEKMMGHG